MEIMYVVLGLVMFYTWVHSIVIIVKKIKDTTKYEKVVLSFALAALFLYLLGTIDS